ncbi:MAG TPA: methyltransferase domain-containing protein [Longimicrobiales bacterium]|nr:methyltransferase domain-containing protein [Longimicrobiales bacterium]
MLPELRDRVRLPEKMDDPGLDPVAHREALGALSRVNRVSGTTGRAWRFLRDLPHEGTVRVLDVGCGGGDVVLGLARRAARERRAVHVTGLDRSRVALDHARARVAPAPHPGVAVAFTEGDVADGLPPGPWHLVLINLFLHHLPDPAIVRLLREVRGGGASLLAQDLHRSRTGYVFAWAGLRLLSRSRIGHHDGPVSVRGGFRPEELLELAREAGLEGARVRRAWPERLVLSWTAPVIAEGPR